MDLYIILSPKDISQLALCVECLQKNTNIKNIYAVTKVTSSRQLPKTVHYIDEDQIGIDKKKIKLWFDRNGYSPTRTNWYFQQFLKLAVSTVATSDTYVIWDGDTILLQPLDFIDTSDGVSKYIRRPTNEYHRPYFRTMKRLIGLDRLSNYSFISEFAVCNTEIIKDLILDIEKRGAEPWYINIMNQIDPEHVESSGFSEYETIGNYQLYRGISYDEVHGKSLRRAGLYFSKKDKKHAINALRKRYLFMSFEAWEKERKILHLAASKLPILVFLIEKIFDPIRTFKRWVSKC